MLSDTVVSYYNLLIFIAILIESPCFSPREGIDVLAFIDKMGKSEKTSKEEKLFWGTQTFTFIGKKTDHFSKTPLWKRKIQYFCSNKHEV